MIFNNLEDYARFINSYDNVTIGVTSGCFDLLHPLHVEYLNKCSRNCNHLFVLIDSDQLVQQNKNKTPLINEWDRAYMVDNLRSVTGVVIINSEMDYKRAFSYLGRIINKVICFKHNVQVYGQPIFEFEAVTNVIIPDVIRFQSTTEITNHLKQS